MYNEFTLCTQSGFTVHTTKELLEHRASSSYAKLIMELDHKLVLKIEYEVMLKIPCTFKKKDMTDNCFWLFREL